MVSFYGYTFVIYLTNDRPLLAVTLGIIYFVYAIPALCLLYTLSRYIKTQENLYAVMSYMAITGGKQIKSFVNN